METTVQEFHKQAAQGAQSFTVPEKMKVGINSHRCYKLEKVNKTGYKYLIVPVGSPQQNMYWRSAMPNDVVSIFEEPKVAPKQPVKTARKNTGTLPVQPKTSKPIKVEKK